MKTEFYPEVTHWLRIAYELSHCEESRTDDGMLVSSQIRTAMANATEALVKAHKRNRQRFNPFSGQWEN